jgi:hypothetical protein
VSGVDALTWRRAARSWLVATWLSAGTLAVPEVRSAEVKIHVWTYDYDDIVLWHLRSSFMHHAVAAVEWFHAVTDGQVGRRSAFRDFEGQFMTGTYAEFNYTYLVDGREHMRTYYARSGPDVPYLDLAGPGAPTFAMFLRTLPSETHAVALESDASAIGWTALDDGRPADARRNDAELKAVRSIERDLRSRRVPYGGEVVAFVSQPMCASCEKAVRLFSVQYGIDMTINVLAGPDAWASNRFMRRRRAFFDAARAAVPPGKPWGGPGPTPPPSAGVGGWCPAAGRVSR